MAACFLSDFGNAFVAIDPYAANGTLVQDPVFDPLFTSQLYEGGVLPVIYNGSVDFYIADNRSCFRPSGGVCAAISCGSAVCGSRMLGNETFGKNVIDTGIIFGNPKMHEAMATENALRYLTMSSEKHLSLLEQKIATMQGSELGGQYIEERYRGSVDELIRTEILSDASLTGIESRLNGRDADGAIRMLDEYFKGNYGISQAYDARDIFSAVKEKQIGPMQYSEILSRILGANGMAAGIGNMMNKSGILNETLNKEMVNAALDVLKEHPELLDGVKKSMDAIDGKMFDEFMAKALEESFKNKEMMKQLLGILPDILNDEKMRGIFLSSASEAMRKMQETGALERLMETVGDAKIRDKILSYAKEAAPSLLDRMAGGVRNRIKWGYVLPIIAFIIIIIASMKVRL